MHILKIIVSAVLTPLFTLATWSGVLPPQPSTPAPIVTESAPTLGAFNVTGASTYRLKSSIASTDTTVNLSTFKEPTSNIPYSMAQLGTSIAYATIEPQTSRSEFISFTSITQNSDGSAALTGVTRGLTRTPAGSLCTASTTLAQRHSAQSIAILSDSPCLFAEYSVKRNDEAISGSWTFPTPTNGSNPATKDYVDTHVNGGTVSVDRVVVAGTAGESFIPGAIVYFDKDQGKWYRTDGDFASTTENVLIGIAQGAGSAGLSVSGGMLIQGLDTTQVNLTTGNKIYISGTAGATSTTAGTASRQIGVAKSATTMYVAQKIDLSVMTNSTTTNATTTGAFFVATTTNPVVGSFPLYDIGKNFQAFTSSGTWTKPTGVTRIKVTAVGGGGSGGSPGSNGLGSGGGGGGTCIRSIDVQGTSTVNVIVGTGGAQPAVNNQGNAGNPTYFSSYCTATGGGGGIKTEDNVGGAGGTALFGQLNITGQVGGSSATANASTTLSGAGGSSWMGRGGLGNKNSSSASSGLGIGFGAGGAGGAGSPGNQAQGAAGTDGIVLIEW